MNATIYCVYFECIDRLLVAELVGDGGDEAMGRIDDVVSRVVEQKATSSVATFDNSSWTT